jgi:hypothetical protein
VVFRQFRFRIKRVHLGHTSIQIEKNDVLGLRCEMGCLDCKRVRGRTVKRFCQTEKSKSTSEVLQCLASIHDPYLTELNSDELNRTCAY